MDRLDGQDQKRTDAADRAPRPASTADHNPKADNTKQDAPNYDERIDGDRALKPEDISSANDE